MQLSINLNRVSPSDILSLRFGLSQTQLVQGLFEFEGGDSENELEARNNMQLVDADTGIVEAAIVLVALPNDAHYPVELHLNVRVLLLYFSDTGGPIESELTSAVAVGSIVKAQGTM